MIPSEAIDDFSGAWRENVRRRFVNAAAREGGGRGGCGGVRMEVRERMSREVCVLRFTFEVCVCGWCGREGSGRRRDLWLYSRSGLSESGVRRVKRREVKNVRSRGTRGALEVDGLEVNVDCWPERSAKAVVMQRRDSRVVWLCELTETP